MNIKIYQKWKRVVSIILMVCLTVGMMLTQTSMAAYASTELPNENLGPGRSEATAYGWVNSSITGQDVGSSTSHFDLRGLEAGQDSYANSGIMTSYQNKGYGTYIQVDSTQKVMADGAYNGAAESLAGLGVELRIALSPSPDDKYIFVDYYVYDTSGQGGAAGRTVKLGTGTDVMIGGNGGFQNDDHADIFKTSRGFHMVNRHVKTSFDCITNDDTLGITPPDTRWIGRYNDGWGSNIFNESTANSLTSGIDCGMAYSWNFQLRPYETVHKRVAFAIRDTSYYVSASGSDSNAADGTYSNPYQTIEYALGKIGNKKGYIYIMDYPEITQPINVTGSNADITIASTDFDRAGNPTTGSDHYIKTLKRSDVYTGPIFLVSDATLKLTDLVLDGNAKESEDPLLSASTGKLEINSGADVRNCKGSAVSSGSAVNVTGMASLSMNYGTVSGNSSAGKGAVYFDSTGSFQVINDVNITGNTKASGGEANVYLANGRTITVAGDLGGGKIGVTTEQQPEVSQNGISTDGLQEVIIANPQPGSGVDSAPSPFVDNFSADQDGTQISGGTKNLPGTTGEHDRRTVLKKSGQQMRFTLADAATGGAVVGGTPPPAISKAAGDPVDVAAPSEIEGYELAGVTIDQGSSSSLSADLSPGGSFGRITGTMPNQDVEVVYEYNKIESAIIFNSNGGTPEPQTLRGTAGSPVTSLLPSTSRYGYLFDGWSLVNDWDNPQFILRLPAFYPIVPVTYHAIFSADPSVKFNYTVEHMNQSGSIVFTSRVEENTRSVETPIVEEKERVRGYLWSQEDSGTIPAEYNFSGTSVPIGTFDGGGTFNGTMPGQDATVRYRYQVNYDDEGAKSAFEVRHETASGTEVSSPQSNLFFPEADITARPVEKYGYACVGSEIRLGDVAQETEDGWVYGVRDPEVDADFRFTGIMPNQPVQLVYLYETTIEGYDITTKYEDNDTGDNSLKDIIEPVRSGNHAAETSVSGMYLEQYGYDVVSESVRPSGMITFNSHDWSGIMPNDDVLITYQHDRIPSMWADLTYRAGQNGSLHGGAGVSADVRPLTAGSFQTSVLIHDGTDAGREHAYTLEEIKAKRLMPIPEAASEYYRFAGWFVDTDQNGILNGEETILLQDHQFRETAAITAYFEEAPGKWIDIHFAAGERGSINAEEPLSLHTKYDTLWGAIDKPDYMPEVNYLADDWYVQGMVLEQDSALTNGETYTIQFYPDPGIFGTDVSAPEAVAGLNSQGKGQITIFGTTLGYQYILTDLTGKVLAVNRGNILTSRTVFEDLYPGMRYLTYEATGQTQVKVGDRIYEVEVNGSNRVISTETEVLTPVVVTNYQIYYDEADEGKTQLSIKPADQVSDYAVLDSEGNVVSTPQTGNGGWQKSSGTPGSLIFTGLDYNKDYTVVARPTGQNEITAESRRADGSVITTDPGGELELPTYIIETLDGTIEGVADEVIGAGRYDEAHKGDQVRITAEAENDAGRPFSHWEFTIGSVPGLGNRINERESSFIMPDANLVLTAVYTRAAATPSNAKVVDEVRGGKREELAIAPYEIPGLEEELTTDADRELLDVNHADVTYKVVYRKNTVKDSETNAIKAGGEYDTDHESAYTGAWGLDVSIERYVNGRKVARASDSNATFTTYLQMEKDDVDMMDYQLYEITETSDGDVAASLVTIDDDPEETGGLFTFTATEGSRYVMVYNRAYRMIFLNNTVPAEHRIRHVFKVRRNEAPSDSYYDTTYGALEEPLEYFINPEGAEFNYEGWSYRQDAMREFDEDRAITRKTYVYAFYENNVTEVDDARKELEDFIKSVIDMSDDHFLKREESKKLKEFIDAALEVLDKENPKASISELESALAELKRDSNPYKELLEKRYDHYDEIQEDGNKGGSGGGGGGGGGTKKSPYNAVTPKSYRIGTNGNWEERITASGEKQMSFVLNGGMRLTNMWARLEYPEGSQQEADGWYLFDKNGIMQTGWVVDESGNWYYCNTEKEGTHGKMATSWRLDTKDGNWYYLDPVSGVMALGWKQLGGTWYYFSPVGAGVYTFSPERQQWAYGGGNGRPLGSMYDNEVTPDGYQTGADGAWIQ